MYFKTILFTFFFCNFSMGQKITYDFSCMESDNSSWFINMASDVEQNMVRNYGQSVSIDEEIKLGKQLLSNLQKETTVYSNGQQWEILNKILMKLVQKISSPRGFSYSIYLIESKELNAYTCGAKIFITTKMYTFCKDENELAAIIGHEIAHNELKHINDNIARFKTANSFGTIGNMTALIGDVLTSSFNQKNEVHCDFVGIDLMKKAGFSICSATEVWKRMALKEKSDFEYEKFFSTHPYSQTRKSCCRNHILTNYNFNCD